MRFTGGKRRAIIKIKKGTPFSLRNGFLENLISMPKIKDFLLQLWKIQFHSDFLKFSQFPGLNIICF